MKFSKLALVGSLIFLSSCCFPADLFAAGSNIPSTQTAGGLDQSKKDIEKKEKLEKKVTQEKAAPVIEDQVAPAQEAKSGEKVLVKKFKVEGAVLLPEKKIIEITGKFENKELSFSQIKQVADFLTDAYRTMGYPTSRAYLPPQTIGAEGEVLIKVIEGTVGEITVNGNKYFKDSVYLNKLGFKKNDPFNYQALQKALSLINERPDRFAKVVLMPGKTPGQTDLVLEVKDSLPIHAGYIYDNFGSRYMNRDRHSVTLEHNNLLGFDDQLYLQFQRANHSLGTFYGGRYLFPATKTLNLGLTGYNVKTKLGKEFIDLDAVGKTSIFGVFLNKALIYDQSLDVRLNAGFDYKKIRNYIWNTEISRDDARVAKIGFDVDNRDSLGRTLFTTEFDQGIPELWGGLDAKDPRATRVGSGGKFSKGLFNLYRAQPLFFDTSLLLKNSAQYTNNALTDAEQFQLGGPYTVRGYPVGEYGGDRGLYSGAELSIPYYFIPRGWKVPYCQDKWYDASRFVVFYDWGTVRLNNPQPGEPKSRTLKSCGFGFRFDLTNRLSVKADFGYPIGGPKSSDTKRRNVQPWLEFTWKI